jgi:hypothetical protein
LVHALEILVRRGLLEPEQAARVPDQPPDSTYPALGEVLGPADQDAWPAVGSDGRYVPVIIGGPPAADLTFDSLVASPRNAFVREVAEAVAAAPAARSAFNPFYVYGSVGTGKTHLLSAIANAAVGRRALVVNASDLEIEYERAGRLACRAELRRWLVSVDVLLVDDIQLCEAQPSLQGELFALMNHMTRAGRQVVISSDVPPTRLEAVEARLLSRLGGGVIANLSVGDRSARREILRRRVLGGREVPEPVLAHLAEHARESVRRLIAAGRQLLALADRTGLPIDLDLARAVIPLPSDLAPADPPAPAPPVGPEVTPPPAVEAASAQRFRVMLDQADGEAEQALAIEIALSERLRQLRQAGADAAQLQRLEQALVHVREGRPQEAAACIGRPGSSSPSAGRSLWPLRRAASALSAASAARHRGPAGLCRRCARSP